MFRGLPRRGLHRPSGTLGALARGLLGQEATVRAFEREAAAALGVGHVVATGTGRVALALILRALGLEPGDEVLVPALTFHAVPTTIAALGLTPVFVDVLPDTLQMDPEHARLRVGPRCRVLLATHLAGLPCDLPALSGLCDERGLVLVEDFAQAALALHRGRPVGSFGRAAFTSLETVKPLAAFGGGLAATSDESLAAALRTLAAHLRRPPLLRVAKRVALGHVEAAMAHPIGFGLVGLPLFRLAGGSEGIVARYKRGKNRSGDPAAGLHPVQAGAGRLSLARIEEHLACRRRNAETLAALLPPQVWRLRPSPDDVPSWYQFLVRTGDPERCVRASLQRGIDAGRGAVTDVSGGACGVAAAFAAEVIQIPSHPGLTEDDLLHVARTLAPWLC